MAGGAVTRNRGLGRLLRVVSPRRLLLLPARLLRAGRPGLLRAGGTRPRATHPGRSRRGGGIDLRPAGLLPVARVSPRPFARGAGRTSAADPPRTAPATTAPAPA